MKQKILTAALCLLGLFGASGLETIHLNGKSYPFRPGAETLGELLPPVEALWHAEIRTDRPVVLSLPSTDPFDYVIRSDMLFDIPVSSIQSVHLKADLEPLDDLEIWISWEGTKRLSRELEEFGRRRGFNITVKVLPKTSSKLITLHRAGGRVPDLVLIKSDDIPDLNRAGAIQTLSPKIKHFLAPSSSDAFQNSRGLWAVPFYGDTQLIYYRSDKYSKLPKGLFSERPEQDIPICWNAYSAYWLIPFQMGFGKKSLLSESGRMIMNDPPTLKSLSSLQNWLKSGRLIAEEREAMISALQSGRADAILSGSYEYERLMNIGIPLKAAPFPEPLSPLLDYKGWVVPKRTHNPGLARYVARMTVSPSFQEALIFDMKKIPAAENTNWPTDDFYSSLRESRKRGTVIPPEMGYRIYKNTMWKLLRFIISGQLSPEEAVQKGQTLIDQRYDQYIEMNLY